MNVQYPLILTSNDVLFQCKLPPIENLEPRKKKELTEDEKKMVHLYCRMDHP